MKNLIAGSKDTGQYRRFLVESLRQHGWEAVVMELAQWLNYRDIHDVEAALMDYLANDDITLKEIGQNVPQ